MIPELRISSLDEAGTLARDYDCVLSLIDPAGAHDPAALLTWHEDAGAARHLVLRLHDVAGAIAGYQEPNAEHVASIIAFGRRLADGGRRALIHCHAGISRSTAAALLILADAYGAGREGEALARLLAVSPTAWPNERIVALGDAALARGGRLVAVVADYKRQRVGAE